MIATKDSTIWIQHYNLLWCNTDFNAASAQFITFDELAYTYFLHKNKLAC